MERNGTSQFCYSGTRDGGSFESVRLSYFCEYGDTVGRTVVVFGCVFSLSSFGRMIYDVVMRRYGVQSMVEQIAGELCRKLVDLDGKICILQKRVNEVEQDTLQELLVRDCFVAGEGLCLDFAELLAVCEDVCLRYARRRSDGAEPLILSRGTLDALVDCIFVQRLEKIESFMVKAQMWALRFDIVVENIRCCV